MKKVVALAAIGLALSMAPARAQTDGKDAYALLILPVKQIVPNEQYEYLRNVISGILSLSLGGMDNIELADPPEGAAGDYAGALEALVGMGELDIYLLAEYFLASDGLHMTVTVLEAGSARVKESYKRVMPADLDMIRSIEDMARFVAVSVSQSLPRFSRDEILSRQVAAELKEQMDRDERRVSEIFKSSHEISLCALTGLSTGKSLASWSEAGPLATVPLALEYRYRNAGLWHLSAGIDWLPFDLMQSDPGRSEIAASIMAGTHTASLISLGWSAGLSLGWAENNASAALSAFDEFDEIVYPPAARIFLCLPVEAGLTHYVNARWFYNLRVRYSGLSWTFEGLSPDAYPNGAVEFRYRDGFSPWSLLQFSLMVYAGVRL